MPDPLPELLTTAEVAELFRVRRQTVARWNDQGRLRAVDSPGRDLRFRRSDVEALLEPLAPTGT